MTYAKKKKLTRYDVLIIASMIEREAQLVRAPSLVSAVIYNRLKQGMPLAIDATTRYSTNNWQRSHPAVRLTQGRAVQHPAQPRAARRRRSATPGWRRSRPPPSRPTRSYLFYVRKPGEVRRARVLVHRRAVRARSSQTLPGLAPGPMIRLGVCGWPVAHSRSPQMHNAALARAGPERLALPAAAAPAAPVHGDGARRCRRSASAAST